MKTTFTIFKKELKETLRDRRTLITMLVIPFALLPFLFYVMTIVQKSQKDKILDRKIRVAMVANNNGEELSRMLNRRKDFDVKTNIAIEDFNQLIRNDSLDLGIVLNENFDQQIMSGQTADIDLYFDSTQDSLMQSGVRGVIQSFHQKTLTKRLDSLNQSLTYIAPTRITPIDVYTKSESLGKLIGGLLPYMFVLFCFMGAMYPAIDLFTGEKERGTMETLLASPASRLSILLGKMGVLILGGTVSGLLTILGLFVGLKINPEIPDFISSIVHIVLEPQTLSLIILMLIPLTIFFAGILIPAALSSNNFKEAQSRIQPMMFIVILPLLIGTLPGIKLDFFTALIPILNVALASREIIAQTIAPGLLILVFGSLILLAGISIMLCLNWFKDERKVIY